MNINWTNISNKPSNLDIDSTNDVLVSWTNVTYDAKLDNATVIRRGNTTWLDKWYTGTGYYTDTNFTSDYYAITSRYTSANFSSEFTNSSNISISNGVITFNMTCEQITGGSGLCDGTDDTAAVDTDDLDIVNTSMLNNDTIIRDHNTTWITLSAYDTPAEIYSATPHTNRTDTDITDLCVDTAAEIYSLVPHTNRTDADINLTVDEPTILRSFDNKSYFQSFDSNASTGCGDDTYLDGNGLCILFNATVEAITASTTYNASAISTIEGTLDGGTLTSIQNIDLEWYNVSEDAGGSPLLIEINFTGVETFSNILLRSQYMGGLGHEIEIQTWN